MQPLRQFIEQQNELWDIAQAHVARRLEALPPLPQPGEPAVPPDPEAQARENAELSHIIIDLKRIQDARYKNHAVLQKLAKEPEAATGDEEDDDTPDYDRIARAIEIMGGDNPSESSLSGVTLLKAMLHPEQAEELYKEYEARISACQPPQSPAAVTPEFGVQASARQPYS